jgi:hypothetical protein
MVLLGITMMPAWSAFQLRRASLDAAGGGSAESDSYQIVVAYGQHDADQAAFSAHYTWQGGVYAQLPGNVIFADGFEVD